MSISAICPNCRSSYTVPDNLFGKKIRCSRCQGSFVAVAVPRADPVSHQGRAGSVSDRRSNNAGQRKSIAAAVIGGSIVAAIFALVLVGGIAAVLLLKPGTAAPTAVAQNPPETKAKQSDKTDPKTE